MSEMFEETYRTTRNYRGNRRDRREVRPRFTYHIGRILQTYAGGRFAYARSAIVHIFERRRTSRTQHDVGRKTEGRLRNRCRARRRRFIDLQHRQDIFGRCTYVARLRILLYETGEKVIK